MSSPPGRLHETFIKKDREKIAKLEKHNIKSRIGSIPRFLTRTDKIHFHWN